MRLAAPIVVASALALASCTKGGGIVDGDAGVVDAGMDADDTPAPPKAEPGKHAVTVTSSRRVIPGPGFPAETPAQNSNNNLDVIRHDGRVYLAWRTGPDHYASDQTVIHVVSSTDETTWKFEASFKSGADLREPRFLSLNGSLFLYLARLGRDALKFEPQGISVAERKPDGAWTSLEPIYEPGFLAWRTRTVKGKPYMLGYMGGEHIYTWDGLPLEVRFLTTTDGRTWVPVDPQKPAVHTGGGSETDFALGDDGTLYGVIRVEAVDPTGLGSRVCRAPAGDIANWSCKVDKKKYDSPNMFWHDGEAYLFGRRNVTETGDFDLGRTGLTPAGQAASYQLEYKGTPKRCSLWRYVQGEDRFAYILDLPSRGDTCFAGVIEGATPDELVVYDYTSDPEGPDLSWGLGQAGKTYIYRHTVKFARR